MATLKREQILQEAEKLAARGKLDAAAREYRRALEHSPNDTNTLNRLGDLLVRANQMGDAIDVYTRIASHFSSDGFFLKAIAIYKKINRLDPQRTAVYEDLADLYFKQGLVVEGRQQLLTLADWFLRSKHGQEAVRVYRKLIELEPNNFQARARLVDLLAQIGGPGEAAHEIDGLGRALLARGALEEAVKLYHRALGMQPESVEFVVPCIDALLAAGRTAPAVELASKALQHPRVDNELRRAAARAFADSGDVERARRLLDKLPADMSDRTDVVQIYGNVMIRSGDPAEAKGRMLPVVDRLLGTGESRRAAVLIKDLLREAPGDVDVLERALKAFDRRDDPDMVMGIEAALADAYFRAGNRGGALKLYKDLARIDPANRLFAQRLEALGAPAAAPLPPAARPSPAVVVAPAAPPAVPEPARETRPAAETDEVEFVDVDFGSEPIAAADLSLSRPARVETAPPTEEEVPLAATNAEELYTEAVVFAKYGLAEKAISHLHRLLALDADHKQARELLASLGGGEVVELEEAPAAPAVPEAPAGGEVAVEARVATDLADVAVAPSAAPSAAGELAGELHFQAPDFGYAPAVAPAPPPAPSSARGSKVRRDVPPVSLDSLEAILGLPGKKGQQGRPAGASAPQAAAPARAEKGKPGRKKEAALAAAPPVADIEVLGEPVELVEVSDVLAGPDEGQLGEVDFLIRQGLLADGAALLVKTSEGFESHPEVLSRQAMLKARGWDERSEAATETGTASELFTEEEQFFDLAAELEKELADDDLVAEATGRNQGGEASIEELFREFQRGVAEQLGEGNYDTHFNLGIAYREMGLLDEAIGEFQLASKAPELFIECASMIGACYLDKGLPDEAAEWYTRALHDPGITPDAAIGMRYELGNVQELSGNTSAALASFAEVLAVNPGFRDVVGRVARLSAN